MKTKCELKTSDSDHTTRTIVMFENDTVYKDRVTLTVDGKSYSLFGKEVLVAVNNVLNS